MAYSEALFTALAAVPTELLDPPEEAIHVAGILAENPALQHQSIARARAVADLAKTNDALVGANLEERRAERRADYFGDAHVGDPERRRF